MWAPSPPQPLLRRCHTLAAGCRSACDAPPPTPTLLRLHPACAVPLSELQYHQPVAPPHLVQGVLQRCPPGLAALSLAECSLCDIPAAVRAFSCLQWLDLSHNRFEDLSPLSCLASLTHLSLERCEGGWAGRLGRLATARRIPPPSGSRRAHGARLQRVEPHPQPARRTAPLPSTHRRVGLRGVPAELRRLTALRSLSLRHNPETQRDSWSPLAALQPSLTRLDMSGTGLAGAEELPPALAALTNLAWLDASSNGVHSWRHLAALTQLTHLALRSCRLEQLPAEAVAASGLRSLDLSRNERLSEEGLGRLAALPGLTHLNLGSCSVCRLPPSLSALTRLHELLLAGNGLLRGLGVLRGLPLAWLDVRSCFFAEPPPAWLHRVPGPPAAAIHEPVSQAASTRLLFDTL